MGFRLGAKLSSGLGNVTRIGKKVLGETSRIGHKISSEGGKAVSIGERIPVIGAALAPATGVIRSGLGLVQNVADLASTGQSMLTGAEGVLRAGTGAIRSGDAVGAMEALRRGKELKVGAQSNLERARKVATDAGSLGRSSQSAFAQTQRNLNRGLVGGILGGLMDP
jgi:hypothetical protein